MNTVGLSECCTGSVNMCGSGAHLKVSRTKIVSIRATRASMTPTRDTILRARLGLSRIRG